MNKYILGAMCAAVLSGTAQAATLDVQGGILMGAFDVDVGGTLYNVEFLDGTCITLFDGCDDPTQDFAFTTSTEAVAAADALFTQVFLDGPQGNFDSDHTLIFGCPGLRCDTFIPYALLTENTVVQSALARSETGGDNVFDDARLSYDLSTAGNTTVPELRVYAVFEPSVSAVPVPTAAWLFGSGLLGLVGIARRKKS